MKTKIQNLIIFILNIYFATGSDNNLTNKQIYENLKKSLTSIKKSCGEICDQTITGTQGEYFEHIKKNVDCESIFSNPNIDNVAEFKEPPMKIPKWLISDYNYGGKVEIVKFYKDDSKRTDEEIHWTKENGDWTWDNAIREQEWIEFTPFSRFLLYKKFFFFNFTLF